MEKMSNKEYRAKLRKDPHSVLSYIDKDIGIVVKTNTKETIYMALSKTDGDMPNLSEVNAAGTVSSAGTVGSIGTFASTLATCVSTASSIGTIATAGSADTDAASITIG